ncbi:phage tail protein [Paenibacillus paeoniae]|uniref:Phage tail protein n=1 Tax=Paenibacillus paeoniae TaxID=2292705 RepID=A0A371P7R8_9BACL|nr:phage tail protein [Paenibacillus paeoniae]REK71969.1 phage tail protein [Paenibacillus paeoniae]
MSTIIDFKNVSTSGLDSSPVAEALAGLRANEARYFMNKYKHEFTVEPAGESQETLDYVERVLKEERGIAFAAKPLETARFQVENIQWAFVFYEDGLAVNVMYTVDDPKKRAVGFKLSEGMEVPSELEEKKFKFARQKSKLAGTIRGTFFVIKGEH